MKKNNWVAYGIIFGTLVGLFTENSSTIAVYFLQ